MRPHLVLKSFLFTGLFLLYIQAIAQEKRLKLPVTLTTFVHGVMIPFTHIPGRPLHPGGTIGTEIPYTRTESRVRFFQTANVGYYYHRHFAQGVFAQSEVRIAYRSKWGMSASALIGAGYLHVFRTQQEFRLINGEYRKAVDWGKSRFMPSVGVEVGYSLHRNDPYSSRLFMRYQGWVEYPFSPGFIPFLPHVNLHLGYTFFPTRSR